MMHVLRTVVSVKLAILVMIRNCTMTKSNIRSTTTDTYTSLQYETCVYVPPPDRVMNVSMAKVAK